MERTQLRTKMDDPHLSQEARAAELLERLHQDAELLARRAMTHPAEPFGMMHLVTEDLERVAIPLIRAVEHCNRMLSDPLIERDVAMLRDTTHLCARIEAMVSQLEDTVRTLERLMERPALDAAEDHEEVIERHEQVERSEQVDRPSMRRVVRGTAPVLEA